MVLFPLSFLGRNHILIAQSMAEDPSIQMNRFVSNKPPKETKIAEYAMP